VIKIKKLAFILIIFISSFCPAQKYGNIWYFGDKAGIDFNTCATIALTNGQNIGPEGSATICDTSGQLLFYTNSDTVWNKQGYAMSNGALVSSNGTLSQVIIIPQPSLQNMFYIITTQIQGQSSLNLQYHVVNMNLNGGLGDVVSKNNLLIASTITEQIAATYHNNGTDIWFITHEYGNNKFLCYLVNSTGINSSPVISNVGPAIVPCNSGMNARGEIKFSPDGKKVAFNNNGIGNNPNSDYMCLFDFDNATGIVSNPINLAYERGGYGLSFSPDNTKLYAATWKALNFTSVDSNKVFQFDISGNDSVTISNTKTILYKVPLTSGSPFGSLKIGPNGKIYVSYSNSNYIGVINSPNQSGISCNYTPNGFYLGGRTTRMGLNNYIEYKTYCGNVNVNEFIKLNTFDLFPNPTTGIINIKATDGCSSIAIYNSLGELIYENKKSLVTEQIDISKQKPGIYFCKVKVQNGENIFKIIKMD
jgi:hypothetical protein